jgi:hypothetical protein
MQTIHEQFREVGVELNPDWLAALELCSDEPLTEDSVYRALIDSDLRESCVTRTSTQSVLSNLRARKQLPRGSYFFQISESSDISIPDAQRPRTEGGDSGKRMLKFKLRSGNGVELSAVELEPVVGLGDNPDAGTKLIIQNSPLFHDGLVLLRPENVKLVGGEVEKLTTAQKAIVAERIRLRDPLCSKQGTSDAIGYRSSIE